MSMKRNKTRWHSFEGLTEKQRREKAKRGVIIAVFLFVLMNAIAFL